MKIPISGMIDVSSLEYDVTNPTRLTEELSRAILVNLKTAQDSGLCFNFPSTFEGVETYDKWGLVRAYISELTAWVKTEESPEPPVAPMLDDMLSLGMSTENLLWIFGIETLCLLLRYMAKNGVSEVLQKAMLTNDREESLLYLLQRFPNKVMLGYSEIDFDVSEG